MQVDKKFAFREQKSFIFSQDLISNNINEEDKRETKTICTTHNDPNIKTGVKNLVIIQIRIN